MEVEAQKFTPLGQKRRAEDDLRNEQRLTKRFDLLNLEQNSKLYIPVQENPPKRSLLPACEGDSMQVDDTKDRIYIHNLDDEISDTETEEEKLVFLPDIEKKLGKIPKSVLLGDSHPAIHKEMVLYNVPTSLSVPEDQDKVRKAIIESRARVREKQREDMKAMEASNVPTTTKPSEDYDLGHPAARDDVTIDLDVDAMEIE